MSNVKRVKHLFIIASFAVLTACAANPPVASNHVMTAKASVKVELMQSALKIGEWITFRYHTDKPGFMNVYVIHSSGKTSQLLQNKQVKQGVTYRFPSSTDSFDIKASAPVGVERFVLVYTKAAFNPLQAGERKGRAAPAGLTLSSSELLHRLDEKLNTLNSQHWSTSEATLNVR